MDTSPGRSQGDSMVGTVFGGVTDVFPCSCRLGQAWVGIMVLRESQLRNVCFKGRRMSIGPNVGQRLILSSPNNRVGNKVNPLSNRGGRGG